MLRRWMFISNNPFLISSGKPDMLKEYNIIAKPIKGWNFVIKFQILFHKVAIKMVKI